MSSTHLIPSRRTIVNHSSETHAQYTNRNMAKNEDGIDWEYDLNTAKEKEITAYKAELEELKTKEVAYKQTIEKGDAILEKVQSEYEIVVSKLESENKVLKEQL